MSNPFPPDPNGPQQPNQGWNQQPGQQPPPQGGWQQQPGQPQQGWGQQPGQPGGYPPAGQPGFYGGPPPPPPRKSKLKKILIPIAILVVLAIAGVVVKGVLSKDAVDKAKVGDCITSTKNKSPKVVSCSESGAVFKVVAKFTDTSDTSKCDDEEVARKGSVLGLYRKGSDKGLLCVTVTEHTTPDSFSGVPGASATFTSSVIAKLQKVVADGQVTDDELQELGRK
ncbi:LppU/SCO3897 family protein [Embleya sp. MST-111070]|uniref:LppU/SCO3897 family protein n=1 Tax=Embleya sp. MST-111070 TaxID=3398231 RepID=UPI003F74021B